MTVAGWGHSRSPDRQELGMKSLGKRPQGLRLERLQSSPLWTPQGLRNRHPVLPGLRDPGAARPTLTDFLRSGLRATWLGHSTMLVEIAGKRVLTDRWACPSSPRWVWAHTWRSGACRPSASPSWTGGKATGCRAVI
jgi:hypothetical protein